MLFRYCKLLFGIAAIFALGSTLMAELDPEPEKPGSYIPDDFPLPARMHPLLSAGQVSINLPGVGRYRIGQNIDRTSLAGTWKFSGMESAELPFPATATGDERQFIAPSFD
ncbi:MAG: hypothetical protein PHI35_07085, partial [Victivallaceae bacterium]|nr:hypothetical protein [Victivallaceae bacterium]